MNLGFHRRLARHCFLTMKNSYALSVTSIFILDIYSEMQRMHVIKPLFAFFVTSICPLAFQQMQVTIEKKSMLRHDSFPLVQCI